MKKILSIIGIAVLIAALGVGSYYYFVHDTIDPRTGKKETFRQFLPFGSSENIQKPDEDTDGGNSGGGNYTNNGSFTARELPALQQITTDPVGGSMILEAPYASSTVARYVDRATGNIHDFDIQTGLAKRITNTTLPKIIESVWSPKGSNVIFRSLENDNDYISSYYAEFEASTTPDGVKELRGSFLPTGIDSIVRIGSTEKIFSLTADDTGATGYVSGMNGASRVTVLQSPIREWVAEGINPTTIALTTKASSYTDGFLYILNPSTTALTKILGNVRGLTTRMSPNGKFALISENVNGFTLKLLDIENKKVTSLSINTLPEKCVWTLDSLTAFCGVANQKLNADFLDLWYQGIVSTNDEIWAIYPTTETVEIVAFISDKNSIDITHLSVDSKKKYLTFENKKDLSLWVYRLPQPTTQATSSNGAAKSTSTTQSPR